MNLVKGFLIHQGNRIPFFIEELVLLLIQTNSFNGFAGPKPFIELCAVSNVFQFHLQISSPLSWLRMLGFYSYPQTILVLDNISRPNSIPTNLHNPLPLLFSLINFHKCIQHFYGLLIRPPKNITPNNRAVSPAITDSARVFINPFEIFSDAPREHDKPAPFKTSFHHMSAIGDGIERCFPFFGHITTGIRPYNNSESTGFSFFGKLL